MQGPQGAQGPQGPQGPTGPAGAAGVGHVYSTTSATDVFLDNGGDPVPVSRLDAPAGSYYVSATGMGGDPENDANTRCTLESVDVLDGGTTTTIDQTAFDTFSILGGIVVSLRYGEASFALSGVATIGAGSRFEVDCSSDDPSTSATPEIDRLTLSALPVGAVN